MTPRPNVLWVSFEDTNPLYPCYGDGTASTPHLDRLAAEGCIYPKAFSTTGVCAPSRSAVITGMYPISIGTHHMRTTHAKNAPELPTPYGAVVPSHVKCFTEYFRQAGYYCTNNAKTDYQFDAPFTAWDDCSKEAHWRNRPDPNQPFFSVWNPNMTHESGMWDDKTFTVDPQTVPVPPTFPDTPKVRESLARMYTNIETADGILGELLDQLEEDGLAENTIVVHWSDHGPMPRGKRWPYDSGLHVPMIIRAPGLLKGGSKDHRLVSTIDLGPTMLSLCGLTIPPLMQGRAFLGEKEEEPRDTIFASRDRYDTTYDKIRAARDQRFKYIRHDRPELPYLLWVPYRNRHPIMQEMWKGYRKGTLTPEQSLMFQDRPAEELYNCEVDPHETVNLADRPEHRETLLRLRASCRAWIDEVGDMGEIDEAEMVRSWYPGGVQPSTHAPRFVPIHDDDEGEQEAIDKAEFRGCLQLHCGTQGASMGYRFEGETDWKLYHRPLDIEVPCVIEAKAIRIGYRESEVKRLVIS